MRGRLARADRPFETVIERIGVVQPVLRKSEKKVADVVLADPGRAMTYTMAGLSRAAEVSEPTVLRFCTSIGCDSFQDFRIRLAQTIAVGLPVADWAGTAQDSSGDFAEKLLDHTIASLDRARRRLDLSAVVAAVDALSASTSVLFFGVGASGIVAVDAQQRFPLFGIPCQAEVVFDQQLSAAAMSGPGQVVVVIWYAGHTEQMVTVASEAKGRGATVIAITSQLNPLADIADISLCVHTFADDGAYGLVTSRLGAMMVVDVLASAVAHQRLRAETSG